MIREAEVEELIAQGKAYRCECGTPLPLAYDRNKTRPCPKCLSKEATEEGKKEYEFKCLGCEYLKLIPAAGKNRDLVNLKNGKEKYLMEIPRYGFCSEGWYGGVKSWETLKGHEPNCPRIRSGSGISRSD